MLQLVYFKEDKDYENWDPHWEVIKTVLASICLDILLAGSEIFHKIRLEMRKRKQTELTSDTEFGVDGRFEFER